MSANVAVACATLSVLNGMFFGYALIGFATAAGTLWRCAFDLGPETEANEWGISILFSIINVGGIPFGFVAGWIMETFGRRKAVMLGGINAFVGTALSGIATNLYIACLARIITGLGIGGISSSIPVYIDEMAPRSSVGTLQAIGGPCIPLTIFLGNLFAFSILGPHRDLKPAEYCPEHTKDDIFFKNVTLMAPAALIGLCIIAVAGTIMPESKKWKGSVEMDASEGKGGVHWAPDGDNEDPDERTSLVPTTEKEAVESSDIPSGFRGLLHVPRCIAMGLLLGLAMQGTGINAVFFYAPKFMALGGVEQPMLGSVIIMAWNLLTALGGLALVDRVGRRKLLLPGVGLMAVSLLLMKPVYAQIEAGTLGSLWSFVLLFAYIAGFEFGPGTLFAVVVNEMLPQAVLPTLSPILGMAMGCTGITVTFLFPMLEFHLKSSVFYIFGGIALAVWVFFYACLPETKGQTKGDITRCMTQGKWVCFGKLE